VTRPRGQCRLCHQERELAYSHIIPEFAVEACYDEKHRAHLAKDDRWWLKQKPPRVYLLCDDCETLISVTEKAFIERLRTVQPLKATPRYLVHLDLDTAVLHRLLLSIVWRAHHARLAPERIGKVDLGQKHEQRLRLFLRGELEIETHDYPTHGCIVTCPRSTDVAIDNVVFPNQWRSLARNDYFLAFMGFAFGVAVVGHRLSSQLLDVVQLVPGQPARFPVLDMMEIKPFAQMALHYGPKAKVERK
jgi:hypothetical protein